jgi:hypothetical protein
MFEKWRIKEHMEVSDAAGRHLGTVDSVVIKLARSDAGDGRHHYIDMKWVERIEHGCAYLAADAPLRGIGASQHESGARAAQDQGAQTQGYDGQAALDAGFAGAQPGTGTMRGVAPLFGTSGHGTGMGGSGPV